jgi:hypothetical protein
MFRRDAFEAAGGYDMNTTFWEDLHLFRRLGGLGRIVVLPDALYRYRFHTSSVRLAREQREVEAAVARMLQAVQGDTAHSPLAAYSLAASRLWAGQPPRLLGALRPQSLLSFDVTTTAIFAVAVMAAVSPRGTRAILARVISARDRLAGTRIGSEPLEWRFA